jgi:hypothetical protein
MNNFRLSAVITAYNCAGTIAEAIDSVLGQTRLPDEIVVVDDGSTDQTRQVVAASIEKGGPGAGVRYIYQANQGAGAARNRGIGETSGELIAFLDGDDVWLPEKCRMQEEIFLARPQVNLVSGQAWWWEVASGQRRLVQLEMKDVGRGRRDLLIENWIGNPSMVMLRRSVLETAGCFDRSLRWGQDWELWMRIVSRAGAGLASVVMLPESLIIYRSHPNNLTHAHSHARLACLWLISRRAIAAWKPAWQRPFLLARAWSHNTFQRAKSARNAGRARREQVFYTTLSLLSDPFAEGAAKLKMLGRAFAGETAYQRARQLFRRTLHARN